MSGKRSIPSDDYIVVLYPNSPTAGLRRQWCKCRQRWQALRLALRLIRAAEATADGKVCPHCQLPDLLPTQNCVTRDG